MIDVLPEANQTEKNVVTTVIKMIISPLSGFINIIVVKPRKGDLE